VRLDGSSVVRLDGSSVVRLDSASVVRLDRTGIYNGVDFAFAVTAATGKPSLVNLVDGTSVVRFNSASIMGLDDASIDKGVDFVDSTSVVRLNSPSVVGFDGARFGNKVNFTLPIRRATTNSSTFLQVCDWVHFAFPTGSKSSTFLQFRDRRVFTLCFVTATSDSSTFLQLNSRIDFALLVVAVRTANSSFANGIDFALSSGSTARTDDGSLRVTATFRKSDFSILQVDRNELQAVSAESLASIAGERTLKVSATAGPGALSATTGAAATAMAMEATARTMWRSISVTIQSQAIRLLCSGTKLFDKMKMGGGLHTSSQARREQIYQSSRATGPFSKRNQPSCATHHTYA
jgi:hypothetical protein